MAESFYVPARRGSGFLATEATRGPWDVGHQHAGPPSGLIGRAFEAFEPRADARVVRVTIDILRPVPIDVLDVEVRAARRGKRIELLEASARAGGEEILKARAWRMRTVAAPMLLPPTVAEEAVPLPGPETGRWEPFFSIAADVGYHTHMDWRFVRGSFRRMGPAAAWLKMKVPLVEGETPSPLVRVLVAADSGNGVSCSLDPARYLFINTDLNVFLPRPAEDEWIGMDSRSVVAPSGVGLTETVLHDRRGPVGRALQTLYVAER